MPLVVFTLFVLALNAPTARAGTAVGHPVPTQVASGDGVTHLQLVLPLDTAEIDRCDGTVESVSLEQTYALGEEVVLPGGPVCAATLTTFDDVVVSGVGIAGGSYQVTLPVSQLELVLDPGVLDIEDATALRIAAPDWLTAAALELSPGVHRSVGAGHPMAPALQASIANESVLRD